ncbi:MAG: hypothetical protein KatS3mg131_0868 [Candidatus Tectimicrobiota bacterium]|nr:MAG: hypothetical protein KatS3mg131_0868 [Candidatus Tectomicrobia bacterium]
MRRIVTHMQTEKVMLFPEGTRSRDGRLQRGNRTVGKLLYLARPIVIPTLVQGTETIASSLLRRRPVVRVRFGAPLDLTPLFAQPDTKETAQAIVDRVMQAIAALQQAPSAGTPQPQGARDATALC